jgi:dUTP pyrophosphatase
MINLGDQPYTVRRGDRIAQMIVAPVVRAELREVDALSGSRRGPGGFGHTGVE